MPNKLICLIDEIHFAQCLYHEILNLLSNILGGRRQSDLDSMIAKISTRPQTSTDENGNVKII